MALVDGTDDMVGYKVVQLDMAKLANFKQAMYDAHVQYGYGAKDPHPGRGIVDFSEIDCSGFMRTLLMYADPSGFADFPDGSANQGDWFRAKGFKRTDYTNTGLRDDHVRVSVHRAYGRGNDHVGHIWGGVHGHTFESYGGHGPGERPWNEPILLNIVDECYVLM